MQEIVSIRVGMPQEVRHGGRRVRTGIFRKSVEGRRLLDAAQLEGDGPSDLENHGGA